MMGFEGAREVLGGGRHRARLPAHPLPLPAARRRAGRGAGGLTVRAGVWQRREVPEAAEGGGLPEGLSLPQGENAVMQSLRERGFRKIMNESTNVQGTISSTD